MLVGTKFFLVKEGGSLKMSFPVRKRSAQHSPEPDRESTTLNPDR